MGGVITAIYNITSYEIGLGTETRVLGPYFKEFASISKMEVDGIPIQPVSGILFDEEKEYTIIFYFDKKIKDASGMFQGCPIKSIDLTQFNPTGITDTSYMFGSCIYLLSIKITGEYKPDSTRGMFYDCQNLESLDLHGFHLSNTKDMREMFGLNYKLASIDLSNFDTSNVTDMGDMFYNCSSIKSLDFSKCRTWKVLDMSYMFYRCTSLTEVTMTSGIYNLSNTTNMFYNIKTKGFFYYDDNYAAYDAIVIPKLPSTWVATPI